MAKHNHLFGHKDRKIIAIVGLAIVVVTGIITGYIAISFEEEDSAFQTITHQPANITFSVPIPVYEDEKTGEEIQPTPIVEEPSLPPLPETKLSYIEQLLEKYQLGFTGKFGVVNTATIYDISGDILDTSGKVLAFSVTDAEGNLLDLASIVFKFDAVTSEKSNIIADATIDLLLDNVLVETRQLKINGDTIDNSIQIQVRKGFEINDSLNFTLSDKGNGWSDGSLHELKLIIKNLNVQLSSSSGTNNYVKAEPFTFYLLELKQDAVRKVVVSETGKQISIPKDDDKISIVGHSPFTYAGSCDNSGCTQIASYEGTSVKVKVLDINGNLVTELSSPNCSSSGFSNRASRSNVVGCIDDYIGLSRLTNYTFQIDAKIGGGLNLFPFPSLTVSDTFEYSTPSTQQNLVITCETLWQKTQRCGSNIGWAYP